jgi:hypothetical protein
MEKKLHLVGCTLEIHFTYSTKKNFLYPEICYFYFLAHLQPNKQYKSLSSDMKSFIPVSDYLPLQQIASYVVRKK